MSGTENSQENWWVKAGVAIGAFAWTKKEEIFTKLSELQKWLFSGSDPKRPKSLLIIGPGGVGKSTTAGILSGRYDSALQIPGEYLESLGIEEYKLRDDESVQLVAVPGQAHRRDSTWSEVEASISSGEYHGVILVTSYGYHSIGDFNYKRHKLYKGDDQQFVIEYTEECRRDEVRVMKRLAPYIQSNRYNMWLLHLVTKQDLWWNKRDDVYDFCHKNEYGKTCKDISTTMGKHACRQEFVFGSLVTGNFVTGTGEILSETVAGYEQKRQVASICKLWETISALKEWEESHGR